MYNSKLQYFSGIFSTIIIIFIIIFQANLSIATSPSLDIAEWNFSDITKRNLVETNNNVAFYSSDNGNANISVVGGSIFAGWVTGQSGTGSSIIISIIGLVSTIILVGYKAKNHKL
jgi:hypothetical protein